MNNKVKILKTESEYEEALERIEELLDSHSETSDLDELELLSWLVEKYEEEHHPVEFPDPVEAIKFRMEQEGLTRKDLIPYLGNQSKVSEVLNKKRPLSLSMIRALHEGLGVPAEVLLQEKTNVIHESCYQISDFPFTEMYKRNYFGLSYQKLNEAKIYWEECLDQLFLELNKMTPILRLRQSTSKHGDEWAVKAWQAQVLNLAIKEKLPKFHSEHLNESSIQRIVQLSYFSHGIQLVREALNKLGIHFVILEHLPKTHIDGACFFTSFGNPVIAMTLRYDRQDNFWFTLLHELGHVHCEHVKPGDQKFILDELDQRNKESEIDTEENEADQFAKNSFVPASQWEQKKLELTYESQILEFADERSISPAVIAGRIRWETTDYTKFTKLIGQGEVRKYLLN